MSRRLAVAVTLLALSFAAPLSAQNLVTNGSFDNGLAGWEVFGEASANGGVATLTSSDEFFGFAFMFQCITVQPDQRYRFATTFRVSPTVAPDVLSIAGFYADSNCDFDSGEDSSLDGVGLYPDGTGAFETQETLISAPSNARSALVALFMITASELPVSADFDDVILAPDTEPRIAVTSFPEALVQSTSGGATTQYTVENVGRGPSRVTLTQNGNFFSQEPTQFDLAPGESRIVTITGLAVNAGSYEGASILSGAGVPPGLAVPIRLAATAPPSSPVDATPAANRLDLVSTSPTALITGTATFSNTGTAPLSGILVSDVPWLIPQAGLITIPPGQSVNVTFTIDPTKRADGGDYGSAVGTLTLQYLSGGAGKVEITASPGSATATVAVVHTVSPGSAPGQIPPLEAGELALFIPGLAHAQGSVGLFISDLSLANRNRSGSLKDLSLYFRPAGANATPVVSSLQQLVADRPLFFGDLASTVFGTTANSGVLQIRGSDVERISASANVFNSSNPRGTYGTAIPVFRSDRSAGPGERIAIAGVRADATTHTNLYLQEAAGAPVTFRADFYNEQGALIGTRTESLGAFNPTQLGNVAPIGAVSTFVTVDPTSAGRLLAYATPVDRASGDTWAVVDWSRYFGAAPGSLLVPVAASVAGANNTYFRTDIAITNTGAGGATGQLTFFSRTGGTVDRTISLGTQQSRIVNDVLVSLFNLTGPQVGYLVYTPLTGTVAITSRTYTTVQGQAATFGSGVPSVPMNFGVAPGELRRFGGIEDASLTSIGQERPGTFRTNVGFIEMSGQTAVVRVTLRFSAGTQATATQGVVTRDISLAPRQFLQLNRISAELIGPTRDSKYGDLRNMQLDVEVVGGGGSVVVYTSSVDNGTGDSILRMD